MKKNLNIFIHALTIELRKVLAYKLEFWASFIFSIAAMVVISYLLWQSIFELNKVSEMKGYSLNALIIYYFCISITHKILVSSGMGIISRDIYYGDLNKYLLYPVSYQIFKIGTYFAKSFLYLAVLIISLIIFQVFFGANLSLIGSIQGVVLILTSTIAFFYLTAILELIAFWADNIWSLGIMLRSIMAFCGGFMIPLSFFPESIFTIIHYTPFPFLLYYPIQILTNQASSYSFFTILFIHIFWILAFSGIQQFVWNKGKYKYSGVGI